MTLPILSGTNVTLRPYQERDRAVFVGVFCDGTVMARVDGAMTPAAAHCLFDALVGVSSPSPRVHSAWCAEDKAGLHVGHGALLHLDAELEIGFLLRPEAWGQGFGTEIARLLVDHGLHTLGQARLLATVDTDHQASKRVLEKAGLRSLEFIKDEEGDYLLYST